MFSSLFQFKQLKSENIDVTKLSSGSKLPFNELHIVNLILKTQKKKKKKRKLFGRKLTVRGFLMKIFVLP